MGKKNPQIPILVRDTTSTLSSQHSSIALRLHINALRGSLINISDLSHGSDIFFSQMRVYQINYEAINAYRVLIDKKNICRAIKI